MSGGADTVIKGTDDLDPTYSDSYLARGEAYEAKSDLEHAIAVSDPLKLDPPLVDPQQTRERVQAV